MRQPVPTLGRCSMQVTNAITRQKKEEIVSDLKEKLNNSVIVFGLRYKGLDVSCRGQFRSCRRSACDSRKRPETVSCSPLEDVGQAQHDRAATRAHSSRWLHVLCILAALVSVAAAFILMHAQQQQQHLPAPGSCDRPALPLNLRLLLGPAATSSGGDL